MPKTRNRGWHGSGSLWMTYFVQHLHLYPPLLVNLSTYAHAEANASLALSFTGNSGESHGSRAASLLPLASCQISNIWSRSNLPYEVSDSLYTRPWVWVGGYPLHQHSLSRVYPSPSRCFFCRWCPCWRSKPRGCSGSAGELWTSANLRQQATSANCPTMPRSSNRDLMMSRCSASAPSCSCLIWPLSLQLSSELIQHDPPQPTLAWAKGGPSNAPRSDQVCTQHLPPSSVRAITRRHAHHFANPPGTIASISRAPCHFQPLPLYPKLKWNNSNHGPYIRTYTHNTSFLQLSPQPHILIHLKTWYAKFM